MIVEGIQHHLNLVIVKHVFAMRKPGPNFLRLIIEANENHIQVLVVIAKVGLGAVRGRLTVAGSALNEAVNLRQLAFPCRAGLHLQKVLQRGRTADTPDIDLTKGRRRSGKE